MKRFGLTLIASTLALGLAACDGDDGKNGTNGNSGTPGQSDVLLDLKQVGRYRSGLFEKAAAEIVAYDAASKRLFVVNAEDAVIDVLNVADPANPQKIGTIEIDGEGEEANSVAVSSGIVAVAVQAAEKTDNGRVEFYNAATLAKLSQIGVGAQPDMLTFTPDGKAVLVANEGEPNDLEDAEGNEVAPYTTDPVGSVSVINIATIATPTVVTLDFTSFNEQLEDLRDAGVRIYGPGSSVAQDLEPEYIAVAPNGQTAWVTLQEANSIAVLSIANLAQPTVQDILPLGTKDYMLPANKLDASDRDGPGKGPAILIRNWPVKGLYEPDAIAAYDFNGKTYYVTANEGDTRDDFLGEDEAPRLKSSDGLDPASFPGFNVAALLEDPALGRLKFTPYGAEKVEGDKWGKSGVLKEILVLGGRSFSIWTKNGDRIEQVFDSGSQFEEIIAQRNPLFFNASNDDQNQDSRSDDKGPEPEGLALGKIGGRTFAFVGLERDSGIMVYDISNPQNARFVQYINTRNFNEDHDSDGANDVGPEGLSFIPAASSPNGKPMLAVGNEVSGTTALFQIDVVELKNN
jgi:hypothetical protein